MHDSKRWNRCFNMDLPLRRPGSPCTGTTIRDTIDPGSTCWMTGVNPCPPANGQCMQRPRNKPDLTQSPKGQQYTQHQSKHIGQGCQGDGIAGRYCKLRPPIIPIGNISFPESHYCQDLRLSSSLLTTWARGKLIQKYRIAANTYIKVV